MILLMEDPATTNFIQVRLNFAKIFGFVEIIRPIMTGPSQTVKKTELVTYCSQNAAEL